MTRAFHYALGVFTAGALFLAPVSLRADRCQEEYDRKIHHIEKQLNEEHRELVRAHERAEHALRAHRGSHERREELRRDLERAKDRMHQVKERIARLRREAEHEYKECQRQKTHHGHDHR